MRVTTTEFRKNLFQLVESALRGELIEVTHKGRAVRLVPRATNQKLSRMISRDTINGSSDDLERAQRELDEETRLAWEQKWSARP